MSKQAFALVYIGTPGDVELELSNLIEKFSYEETIDKDNHLEVQLKSDYSLELLESTALKTGKPICFQFGFIGEQLSEVKIMAITDIDAEYSSRVTLKIIASDQAVTLKKAKGKEVYNDATASDIAKQIAAKYGLKVVVTPTTRIYNGLVQGKKNDFQVLKMLAAEEPGYVSYVTNSTVYFVKRGLSDTSTILLTMGQEGVISFTPKWQESATDGDANSTSAVGVDPSNKKIIDVLAGNDSKGDVNLGTVSTEIVNSGVDVIGYVGSTFKSDSNGGSGGTVSGITSVEEAKAKASAKQSDAKIKLLVANLVTIGNPLMKIDTIITIGNVARMHQGNWYVTGIRHDIAGSSYLNNINLAKNAVSRKDLGKEVVNGAVNTSIGADEITNSKSIDSYVVVDGGVSKINQGSKEVVDKFRTDRVKK